MPCRELRRRRVAPVTTSGWLLGRRVVEAADFFQLRLQREPVETADRQGNKNADALMQHSVGILECESDFGWRAFGFGRVGDSPMRGHRLGGPHRARFAHRIVTNRKNKIERWRT